MWIHKNSWSFHIRCKSYDILGQYAAKRCTTFWNKMLLNKLIRYSKWFLGLETSFIWKFHFFVSFLDIWLIVWNVSFEVCCFSLRIFLRRIKQKAASQPVVWLFRFHHFTISYAVSVKLLYNKNYVILFRGWHQKILCIWHIFRNIKPISVIFLNSTWLSLRPRYRNYPRTES